MPPKDVEKHRRSIRLRAFDYRGAGSYFVTVCAFNRQGLFGDIVDGAIVPNVFGNIVEEEWHRCAALRPYVILDAFVVMPNHVHGIVCLNGSEKGKARLVPTTGRFGQPAADSLGAIVGAFKSASTKRINQLRGTAGALLWQKNYFEHVIRNDQELARVREYIVANPARWPEDAENPNVSKKHSLQTEIDAIIVGARRALPSSLTGNKSQ